MITVNTTFIAAGGNRHPSAADWDASSQVLAYGAGRNIAVWKALNDNFRGVTALLSGHTDSVNAVKFIASDIRKDSILLSGGVDGTVRLWVLDVGSATGYRQSHVLHEHGKSVNTIAVLPEANVFVTGAADGKCIVWRIDFGQDGTIADVLCREILSLTPKFFPLAIAISRLSSADSMILAVAGSKTLIQIYVSDQSRFHHAATLTGHEGWIRSLDFVHETAEPDSDLLLASASQDKYIRLWRLHRGEQLPAATDATKDPSLGSIGKSLSNKAHRFETCDVKYSVTFEALLLGHEDWIFTACWKRSNGLLRLLSASADNSLAIWEADRISGVWICTVRLGEISAQKGATTATGSTGGFWIGLWAPRGDAVVSLGRTGSWRLWRYDSAADSWTQDVAVGGHTKEVRGLAWARDGTYLLSTGSDQTTRLFAEWQTNGNSTWHEFTRPQIHGYDLNCIDSISANQFISGADEKLLRVFNEPKRVAELLSELCYIEAKSAQPLPEAASIPVLGLSNKALDADENGADSIDDVANETPTDQPSDLSANCDKRTPPTEDLLARHLLWPETEKLYGHGYEIAAVAASNDGAIVATACRASSIDHAVIRLYDTTSWREIKPPLTAHSLTVTGLQFSADDKYLLSVGRDRQCAVFEQKQGQSSQYDMTAFNPKAHTRMLLDASWAPLDANNVFATAGRDKNIHVWQLVGKELERRSTISASLPITAIAFLQHAVGGLLILAYGMEDGTIYIAQFLLDNLQLRGQPERLAVELNPSLAITRLAWRPRELKGISTNTNGNGQEEAKNCQLAVASEDCSLRVYNVNLSWKDKTTPTTADVEQANLREL